MVSVSGPFSLQINLDSGMKVISRRSISVAYGEPVHPIMQFDPSDSTYLYLMTSYQVRSSVINKTVLGAQHAFHLAQSSEQKETIRFSLRLVVRAKMFRGLAITGLSGEMPVHFPVLGDNTMQPSSSGLCGGQVKRRVKDTEANCTYGGAEINKGCSYTETPK